MVHIVACQQGGVPKGGIYCGELEWRYRTCGVISLDTISWTCLPTNHPKVEAP